MKGWPVMNFKNKNNRMSMGDFSGKKVADKRSVFDSDFIGREGRINPRTFKEVSMAAGLCFALAIVFYFNFSLPSHSCVESPLPLDF
jgi:hypothetical protein